VHATGLAPTGSLNSAGQANPGNNFRYDATLAGYIYNLQTTRLISGTYQVTFTAGSDPLTHTAPFTVR
jgi:hypothetical protein